ncbi:hypothetical protein GYB22_13125 [bacterium]|nr:hypothetical protein [bacterium]
MNQNQSIQRWSVFLPLGVWAFLFAFPLLTIEELQFNKLIHRHWLPLLLAMTLFYLNTLLLIPKLYFSKQYLLYTLINLVLIVASISLLVEIFPFFYDMKDRIPNPRKHQHLVKMYWYRNIISFSLAVGSAIVFKVTQQFQTEEKARKDADNERLKSELTAMRYQIQPHFFFNTLNTIYSLIDIDKEGAKSVLHQLSKLMRYVLYTASDQAVELHKEIDFIRSYIDLMKTRVGEHLKVDFKTPDLVKGKVHPLLLVTLVENAFKHGVHPTEKSNIEITIEIESGKVNLRVWNSNYPKGESDESGSGIGYSNLQKRLDYLYPAGNYSFRFENRGQDYFSELILPLS